MVSFLLTTKDKDKRVAYAKDFCTKQSIDKFDITLIEKDTAKDAKQSIGIEEVKNMQRKISLKPIKSPTKAVIIEDAQLLTTEAQNALLKVLEEPPENTLLILGSDTKEALLPTILSRCQVIELGEDQRKITEKDKTSITEFIEALPVMPIGDRLKKAEALAKDKDKALVWLEKAIIIVRETIVTLVREAHPESLKADDSGQVRMTRCIIILQSFQKLHTTLTTTNVNPRFAIEHTLLQLTP